MQCRELCSRLMWLILFRFLIICYDMNRYVVIKTATESPVVFLSGEHPLTQAALLLIKDRLGFSVPGQTTQYNIIHHS